MVTRMIVISEMPRSWTFMEVEHECTMSCGCKDGVGVALGRHGSKGIYILDYIDPADTVGCMDSKACKLCKMYLPSESISVRCVAILVSLHCEAIKS